MEHLNVSPDQRVRWDEEVVKMLYDSYLERTPTLRSEQGQLRVR